MLKYTFRTNPRVERLYHSIAAQAFKFCQKYQRKAEFRKLCEKLRNHLDLIAKQQHSTGKDKAHNFRLKDISIVCYDIA